MNNRTFIAGLIVVVFVFALGLMVYFILEEVEDKKEQRLLFCKSVGYDDFREVKEGFNTINYYCYSIENSKLEQAQVSKIKGAFYLE